MGSRPALGDLLELKAALNLDSYESARGCRSTRTADLEFPPATHFDFHGSDPVGLREIDRSFDRSPGPIHRQAHVVLLCEEAKANVPALGLLHEISDWPLGRAVECQALFIFLRLRGVRGDAGEGWDVVWKAGRRHD